MTDRERKFLSDILTSINRISTFTESMVRFEDYQNNYLVKSAVERHLAIIGEAVNKYLKEDSVNELTQSRQIINLRNRLIHSYDNIDDRIIWIILIRHLKPLKEEIESKLN